MEASQQEESKQAQCFVDPQDAVYARSYSQTSFASAAMQQEEEESKDPKQGNNKHHLQKSFWSIDPNQAARREEFESKLDYLAQTQHQYDDLLTWQSVVEGVANAYPEYRQQMK